MRVVSKMVAELYRPPNLCQQTCAECLRGLRHSVHPRDTWEGPSPSVQIAAPGLTEATGRPGHCRLEYRQRGHSKKGCFFIALGEREVSEHFNGLSLKGNLDLGVRTGKDGILGQGNCGSKVEERGQPMACPCDERGPRACGGRWGEAVWSGSLGKP